MPDVNIVGAFGASEGRDQRFAIYVPNRDKDGNSVAQDVWVHKALTLLSEICGGATAMPPIRGAWLNAASGNLIIEEPVLVYTYIDPDEFAHRLSEVVQLVQDNRQTNPAGADGD